MIDGKCMIGGGGDGDWRRAWQAGSVCGRYANSRRPEDLVEEFEVERTSGPGPGQDPSSATPDYNVAPTKPALVVLRREVPAEAAAEVPEADDAALATDADGEATADAALE